MRVKDGMTYSIITEIYNACAALGADSWLLGAIGSWGDSLPDAAVLDRLQAWNAAAKGKGGQPS